MGFKGSIVIKRRHLINMMQNEKLIFRSKVSDNSKHISWGQQIAIERIMKQEMPHYNWDIFLNNLWDTYCTSYPCDTFGWLFSVNNGGVGSK